jgi:hypothetical protein
MSLAGALAAANSDDAMTRAHKAFKRAYNDYLARPTVANYERFVEARRTFLLAWGAGEDAA